MIDLHAHILPAIDDGPRELAVALEMARAAVADGVTVMAATPHGRNSFNPASRYSVPYLLQCLSELRVALHTAQIPLELVPGTECYGEAGLADRLRTGELLAYGTSRAVLVEFSAQISQQALEQIVFELQLAGYRVVVAHPERLHYVAADPNRLIPLIERGILLQLTADALLGNQGERLERLARTLLTHRLIHLIASDCHGPHFGRMPNLGQAQQRVLALCDAATATYLTHTVPAAILADTPLTLPEPLRVRRFGIF
jgi:protein-tyrosine phosphatase